jgi:LacI family transcriptional regulator
MSMLAGRIITYPSMTMRELARLAGVTQATISLALRNHPRISTATKNRVARLAREHGYVLDGHLTELMRAIRTHAPDQLKGCLGLIALYPEEVPWREEHGRPYLTRLRRSMVQRARELGYRVESFWVNNPAMKVERLARIMEARGIHGLLSLGAAELEAEMPAELRRFVIVTQGASISTKLHRIVAHFAEDTTLVLTNLKARGYRRPGIVLQRYQDGRNGHIIAGMYLYFSCYVFGAQTPPIFYAEKAVDPSALDAWFQAHRPDVIVYYDYSVHHAGIEAFLKRRGLRAPEDIGLAVVSATVPPTNVTGVHQNMEQLGISAVDMLVGRLQQGETDWVSVPKIECVPGEWVEGKTLRPR